MTVLEHRDELVAQLVVAEAALVEASRHATETRDGVMVAGPAAAIVEGVADVVSGLRSWIETGW